MFVLTQNSQAKAEAPRYPEWVVLVGGEKMNVDEVTKQHMKRMSPEELAAYKEKLKAWAAFTQDDSSSDSDSDG